MFHLPCKVKKNLSAGTVDGSLPIKEGKFRASGVALLKAYRLFLSAQRDYGRTKFMIRDAAIFSKGVREEKKKEQNIKLRVDSEKYEKKLQTRKGHSLNCNIGGKRRDLSDQIGWAAAGERQAKLARTRQILAGGFLDDESH